MSNAFNQGMAHGQGESKANQLVDSAKNTASSISDKMSASADNCSGQGQQRREEAAGFLQQTGDQVAHMAHEASGAVKNAMGGSAGNNN